MRGIRGKACPRGLRSAVVIVKTSTFYYRRCVLNFCMSRSQLVIMIVGAPTWFSVLWKIIRPLINSRTQAKCKICSKKGT
jgi:hypothetical protein